MPNPKSLDEKLVCEKFTELKSIINTAKFFHVNPKRIKPIIISNNLPFKEINDREYIKNLDLSIVKEKYDEFEDLRETAKFFDVSIETIRQLFIRNNIDYKKQIIYDLDHDFFSRDTKEAFYWAGFIAADGNVSKTKHRIKLALGSKDRYHLEKFKNSLKSNAPIFDTKRTRDHINFKKEFYYGSHVSLTSKKIEEDLLQKFNIGPQKSLTYKIPEQIINHTLANHFIRGIIDGDGWIYHQPPNHGKIGLCGTEYNTFYVFNFLKEKLSLESGFHKQQSKNVWAFNYITINDTQKIIHYLYDNATIWLDRKKEKADLILKNIPIKIDIDKEILKNMLLENKSREEMAEYFDCSEPVINRRFITKI